MSFMLDKLGPMIGSVGNFDFASLLSSTGATIPDSVRQWEKSFFEALTNPNFATSFFQPLIRDFQKIELSLSDEEYQVCFKRYHTLARLLLPGKYLDSVSTMNLEQVRTMINTLSSVML
jgi:hypothetical protein